MISAVIFDFDGTLVSADDTPVSKPDPAPYRLAMQRLGVEDGLAIEDTPSGIASAKGAGLHVLAVIGKKNWLFFGSAGAVKTSAIYSTLLETCRKLGLNPDESLRDIRPYRFLPSSAFWRHLPPGNRKRSGRSAARGRGGSRYI